MAVYSVQPGSNVTVTDNYGNPVVGISSSPTFSGVNVGGALTGATTGAFSGNVTVTNTGVGAGAGIAVFGPTSGTNGGAYLSAQVAGVFAVALGNKSAILGGAYDATPYLYSGGATLTTSAGLAVGGTVTAANYVSLSSGILLSYSGAAAGTGFYYDSTNAAIRTAGAIYFQGANGSGAAAIAQVGNITATGTVTATQSILAGGAYNFFNGVLGTATGTTTGNIVFGTSSSAYGNLYFDGTGFHARIASADTGAWYSGSSIYGPTSCTVNGALTAGGSSLVGSLTSNLIILPTALEILGADNFTSGVNNGQVAVMSSTTAAIDKGATIMLGGKSGNAAASYTWGAIRAAKQSAAGDGNYGGYLDFYTTNDGGAGVRQLRIDKAGAATFTAGITATTISPSGAISSTVATNNNVMTWPGYTGTSSLYSSHGTTVAGIAADALGLTNGSALATLDLSGNMGIAGSYYAVSASDHKRGIRDVDFDAVEAIKKTTVAHFNYKHDPEDHEERLGLIADRSPVEISPTRDRHDFMRVSAVTIAALQDVIARLEALEASHA